MVVDLTSPVVPISSEAHGAGWTAVEEFSVTLRLAECVRAPLVAVTTKGYVPAATLAAVFKVSTTSPGPFMGEGFTDAVIPAGRPDTEKLVVPVNPFSGTILTE